MAYRSKVALVYLFGIALDLLNMFAASIAYPDIARELHASVTQLAWISNAYMLGLTLIIPMSVWLAARLGERRLILGSLLLFGATAFGIPVSTTHTITGCIMGVGAAKRTSAVRWGVAQRLVVAWLVTIPAAAIVGAVFYEVAVLIDRAF